MKPCGDENSNICVAEGCYGEACEKLSSDDRQARALEGIARNVHELVKIFTDISDAMTDLAVIIKDSLEKKQEK